jgi:hypothetical protein
LATPYPVTKALKLDLDKKMENMKETVLDYNHLGILLALARLFGGSNDD